MTKDKEGFTVKKAILFDLDGTITDSGEGIINCAQYAFQQMGYPVPPREEMGVFVGLVKNSWNKYNKFGGYFYASEPFMKYKTMNIIVHKNAIPKDIRKKLGIK